MLQVTASLSEQWKDVSFVHTADMLGEVLATWAGQDANVRPLRPSRTHPSRA